MHTYKDLTTLQTLALQYIVYGLAHSSFLVNNWLFIHVVSVV